VDPFSSRAPGVDAATSVAGDAGGQRRVGVGYHGYVASFSDAAAVIGFMRITVGGVEVVPVTVRSGVGHQAAIAKVGLWCTIRHDRGISAAACERKQAIGMRLRAAGQRATRERGTKQTDYRGKESRRRGLGDRDLVTIGRSIRTGLIVERRDGYAVDSVDEPILGGDGLLPRFDTSPCH